MDGGLLYQLLKWICASQAALKRFSLQGMAIGNGLTNPAIQYASYADFSFANGLISQSLKRTINAVSDLPCPQHRFMSVQVLRTALACMQSMMPSKLHGA